MRIIFILISSLTGFFIGSFLGSAALPKGIGLAGGATVLMYGFIGLIIVLLIALFLIKKIEQQLLKKITIILILLNLLPIGWIIFRTFSQAEQTPNDIKPKKLTPTEIRGSLISLDLINSIKKTNNTEVGLGMVKPDFYNKKVLYFYATPNLEKSANDHSPTDSLVFTQTEHHQFEISYAPPWFYPQHLKMDYEILYLKLLSMNRDWAEIEINKQSGQSAWVSKSDVSVLLWPEFLLNVFSIEILDPKNNLLRIKPLQHASEVRSVEYEFLVPILIRDSWVKIKLVDKNFNDVGEAWLRWRSDGKILISYSLLS